VFYEKPLARKDKLANTFSNEAFLCEKNQFQTNLQITFHAVLKLWQNRVILPQVRASGAVELSQCTLVLSVSLFLTCAPALGQQ